MYIAATSYAILGALCLLRGVWRPHRAVLREGQITRCAGASSYGSCDPSLTLSAPEGTRVYAVAPGRIMAAEETFLHILAENEPVLLMYSGIAPTVHEGTYVGRGQAIGTTQGELVRFSVSELVPADNALGYAIEALPPSAWLAARGMRPAAKRDATSLWCDGGRTIEVPPDAMRVCNLKRPEPGKFGLLPIQVEMG